MVMVNNILLHTGVGNPSPVYDPELSRFDGWSRRAPTLVRGIPRGRELGHPGHTPARPLEDRRVPPMQSWQVPAFPQIICFQLQVLTGTTEWHTSPRIATPSVITNMTIFIDAPSALATIQAGLTSTPIATDAQLAACPLFLKLAPEGRTWATPFTPMVAANTLPIYQYPLNVPIPNGPRNRIVIRTANFTETTLSFNFQFHIQPL